MILLHNEAEQSRAGTPFRLNPASPEIKMKQQLNNNRMVKLHFMH